MFSSVFVSSFYDPIESSVSLVGISDLTAPVRFFAIQKYLIPSLQSTYLAVNLTIQESHTLVIYGIDRIGPTIEGCIFES